MREQSDFAANLKQLSTAAWAYAALATALEVGLVEELSQPVSEADLPRLCGIDPELSADLVEALIALGAIERTGGALRPLPSFEVLSGPAASRVLRAEVLSDHLQVRALLSEAREGRGFVGWKHEDPVTLSAQGETGGLFGSLLEALLPGLEDLERRLGSPGFRLLDVGAGVGVISSELCRVNPNAAAVGLEPHRTARELGRSRIAAAGLSERIELRDQRLEQLEDVDAYDLAFLPQPFLPERAVEEGMPRILRALRPGGWLIVLTHSLAGEDRLVDAAQRFRARVWGGGGRSAAALAELIARTGFEGSRIDHPIGAFRTICARRPPVPATGSEPAPAATAVSS